MCRHITASNSGLTIMAYVQHLTCHSRLVLQNMGLQFIPYIAISGTRLSPLSSFVQVKANPKSHSARACLASSMEPSKAALKVTMATISTSVSGLQCREHSHSADFLQDTVSGTHLLGVRNSGIMWKPNTFSNNTFTIIIDRD